MGTYNKAESAGTDSYDKLNCNSLSLVYFAPRFGKLNKSSLIKIIGSLDLPKRYQVVLPWWHT